MVTFGYMRAIANKNSCNIRLPEDIMALTTMFLDTQKHIHPLVKGVNINDQIICSDKDERSPTITGPNLINHSFMRKVDVWQMVVQGQWTMPFGTPSKGPGIALFTEQSKLNPILKVYPNQGFNNCQMEYEHPFLFDSDLTHLKCTANVYCPSKVTPESVFSLLFDVHTHDVYFLHNEQRISLPKYHVFHQAQELYARFIIHQPNTTVKIVSSGFRNYLPIDQSLPMDLQSASAQPRLKKRKLDLKLKTV